MMNEILKKRIEEAAGKRSFKYLSQDRIEELELGCHYEAGFMEGAQYALSHQWISVEGTLPKEEFDVFMNVYVEVDTGHGIEHCVLLATYYSGKFSCESNHVKVIGWMPIPKFETKKTNNP